EFKSLSRLARRLGFAGAGDVAMLDTAEAPARSTSSVSLFISRLISSPLRKAVALVALALAMSGGILGWRWLGSRGVTVNSNAAPPINSIAAPPINSIAVLPFVNVDNDLQIEYLCDGITETLNRSLSQLPGLKVMARGTVFTYKGLEVDPRRVGDDLKVQAVVTGRMRRQGDRLLIRAELADAITGVLLWSDDYERPLADLLT